MGVHEEVYWWEDMYSHHCAEPQELRALPGREELPRGENPKGLGDLLAWDGGEGAEGGIVVILEVFDLHSTMQSSEMSPSQTPALSLK